MPKCPKCKNPISFLFEYEEAEVRYKVHLDIDGLPHSHQHDVFRGKSMGYECPECGKGLFDEEPEAIAFLRGESVEPAQEPEAYYCIIKLCREEVAAMLPEDVRERVMEGTTELDLQCIAEKVGSDLIETSYWETLSEVVNTYFVHTKRLKLSPTAAKPYMNYAIVE